CVIHFAFFFKLSDAHGDIAWPPRRQLRLVIGASARAARTADSSLGRPLPGFRVVILDPQGREAPVGGAGEIAIDVESSPLFWFDAYANDPGRTAARFRHGRRYYLTGDWAFLDGDGNIHFRGRASDAIVMQQAD
ncbi:AMP-binding protein, partial [Azospirillum brasilense]|nr:AMP-binding protein [Azospirillum brasilense]